MLFDLGGKRKRFIQVIYVLLALLMGGGLVLFGIGGDANGGLFDALGISSNSSTADDPSYEKQIDKANEALAANPEDEKALLLLARYQYLSGSAANETDETTGQTVLTEDSLDRFDQAIDAWQRYLDTKPEQPSDDVANLMVQAYTAAIDLGSPLAQDQLRELAETAQIVAEEQRTFGTYTRVVNFAYIAGEDEIGDEAAKQARAVATDETQRKQVDQLVKQSQAQAKQVQQQIAGAGADPSQVEDPTGGLGTSGLPPVPSAGAGAAGAPTPAP